MRMIQMRRLNWRKTAVLASAVTAFNACSVGVIGDSFISSDDRAPAVATWELLTTDTQTLTDPMLPGSGYPNSGNYDGVSVTLHKDALLCGKFKKNGALVTDACGGPAEGLPYFVVPFLTSNELRLRVIDLFGNEIMTSNPVPDTCIFPRGQCGLCSGSAGTIVNDECGLANSVNDDSNGGRPTDEGAGTVTETCFVQGAKAFIDFANSALRDIDMPVWDVNPEELARPMQAETSPDVPPSFLPVLYAGIPRPRDAVDDICETYGAGQLRVGGEGQDDDYRIFESGPPLLRCGHLANDALVTACADEAIECSGAQRFDYELGALAAHNAWVGDDRNWSYEQRRADAPVDCGPENTNCSPPPDDDPTCTGSPLVMSLDETPVTFSSVAEGVDFDLLGTGHKVRTGWVTHGALLVLDRNFNGRIDSGRELFGEGTLFAKGGLPADGFAALAEYDRRDLGGNDNGALDVGDAVFPRLELWVDANKNGESEPGELTTLIEHGITTIGLVATKAKAPLAASGHVVALESDVAWANGRTGQVYDVWFRYSPITLPYAQR